VLNILIDEIKGIGEWSKKSPEEVARQVAPVIGLPEDIALIAVKRQGYDVKPITPAVVNAQQKIADTFYNLKLIPKPLDIRSVSQLPAAAAKTSASNN
jgi:sulfonate transport system substrate-binding protein